jgi:Flp pilus assembly protein TadG
MTPIAKPSKRAGFLNNILRDQAGNTLAMVAAGVIPIIGMVGGAVDMSRSYMTKARLQQACDAGALAARRSMETDILEPADREVGDTFFNFNFPDRLYGVKNLTHEYVQPVSDTGVRQPVVEGEASADVPATLMRVFGQEKIKLTVTCASRKDVAHADVAMVLDVTGSMSQNMAKSSSGGSETRISALRRSVRAFYGVLGPGRAAGDPTKGRIRYAFAPYGVVVNAGFLLRNDQMVDSWTYSTRGPITTTLYSWTEGAIVTGSYGPSTPATIPASIITAAAGTGNYNSFGTGTVGTDPSAPFTDTVTYTKLNGNSATIFKTITQVPRAFPATGTEPATSANCFRANQMTAGSSNNSPGLFDAFHNTAGQTTSTSSSNVATPPPVYPQATRQKTNVTQTVNNRVSGLRYRWFSSGGNACRLESATGRTVTNWTQTRLATGNAPITWTPHASPGFAHQRRTFDVSSLKAGGSTWNQTLNVPGLNITVPSPTSWVDVKLSGEDTTTKVSSVGAASTASVVWRGCVEERQMDNTITASSPLSPLSANSKDLNVNLLSSPTDDNTRWKPYLSHAFFSPTGGTQTDACPPPALRLQEIASYDNTVITTNYPMLFDSINGGPSSYYYPYNSTPANNAATIKNYIDRIPLYDGTTHDAGFIWGFHLLSGRGMFAADNPDYFDGALVSRNLVFMTDGDLNPGEERYVFSGHNQVDGRLAPKASNQTQMKAIQNRRLRMMCEAAKDQGITIWVVVINDENLDFSDLEACATSGSHYKSAKTADELVASFTAVAQSIGGLRLTQ